MKQFICEGQFDAASVSPKTYKSVQQVYSKTLGILFMLFSLKDSPGVQHIVHIPCTVKPGEREEGLLRKGAEWSLLALYQNSRNYCTGPRKFAVELYKSTPADFKKKELPKREKAFLEKERGKG